MILHSQYEFDPKKDQIGHGGFSTVYKATDLNLNMTVALKRYEIKANSNKGSVIQEIRKCIHLNHPNVIRYFNCFKNSYKDHFNQIQEEEYGVMEYADSGHFGQILNGDIKVNDDEFKDIVIGILEGLKYLHSRTPAIIHRDLKPANILLNKENGKLIPKICDFGISKTLSTDTITNTTTGYLGSIEYMSPEQLNMHKFGLGGHLQTNTDLWALGCMLYEYFVGKSPFGKRGDSTAPEIIYSNIIDKEPIHGYKQIPEPYLGIVKRCLVKKATVRAENASELLEVLNNTSIQPTSSGSVKRALLFLFALSGVILSCIIILKIDLPWASGSIFGGGSGNLKEDTVELKQNILGGDEVEKDTIIKFNPTHIVSFKGHSLYLRDTPLDSSALAIAKISPGATFGAIKTIGTVVNGQQVELLDSLPKSKFWHIRVKIGGEIKEGFMIFRYAGEVTLKPISPI